jgi:hypothetical protein
VTPPPAEDIRFGPSGPPIGRFEDVGRTFRFASGGSKDPPYEKRGNRAKTLIKPIVLKM